MSPDERDQDGDQTGEPRRPRKERHALRRNRSPRPRRSDWTQRARAAEDLEVDAARSEAVVPKGDASRHRTITVFDAASAAHAGLEEGVVVTVRGLYADVDGPGGTVPCTVRRVLRTRLIAERQTVAVGDRVFFRREPNSALPGGAGVIENVCPRRGQLQRRSGRKLQTIVANVDWAIIVSSADEPPPKPNLIDRYVVSSLFGGIAPVVCMNKIDLDRSESARGILERYAAIGMTTLCTSTRTGEGLEELRDLLRDKSSVFAGQSGVGKSSLLNALQPGLELRIGQVSKDSRKGRHTTTTACLLKLHIGGYVVDTPGIRSFELGDVPRGELEAYFVEFIPFVERCKFANCTHRHETGCEVKAAVQSGAIHPDRYDSYIKLFEEPDRPMAR